MYHLKLRKSLNTACAFNLGEAELRAFLEPWLRGQLVELGEREWNPAEARLTVLKGPRLAVQDLAMSRGWRNAERHGEDVTERMLAEAQAPAEPGSTSNAPGGPSMTSGPPAAAPPLDVAPGDSVGGSPEAQLGELLGTDAAALLQAWRLAAQRRPELSPSESLALAERTLGSLDAGSA